MKTVVNLSYTRAPLPDMDDALFADICRKAPEMGWVHCHGEEEFLRELPGSRAAVCWRFKQEWLDLAPGLEVIATPAAGRELIRVEPRRGLELMFGTFHGELMAETVVGLMLAFARGIKATIDLHDRVLWPRAEISERMFPLRGSHALILGFGHIGKWVGKLLKPFGVRLTGVNRSDLSRPEYFEPGDEVKSITELDALLPSADHLVMVLPGGDDTRNVMDARRLSLLRNGAYVYNVGRGNSLDGAALAGELRSGRLAGAGLDVYDPEPLPADSPLRGCPNAILMPHVSAMSPNYLALFFDQFIDSMRKRR